MRVLQPLVSVNRERVAAALRWLKANNPIYAAITISDENLAQLPEDGIPVEVLASVKWSDDTLALNQERAGYVPDDVESDSEEASWEPSMRDGESDEEDSMGLEDATSSAAVFPILAHGVVDVEGNNIPRSELLAHAFQNMTSAGKPPLPAEPNVRFNVRHGDFVNEYGRRDEAGRLTIGSPDNPNHLLGCYPHLFPYGEGGYETDRKVTVSYEAHAKWSLQYADRRFRKDLDFVFQVFGVLQKRKICTSAAMRMSRSDYQKHKEAINRLTTKDFQVAAEQETKKQQYSNPAMRALVGHLSAVRAGVTGTDQNRASVRAQVWSLITMFNPPSLWITINPSDVNNPIAQVFAGEQIDLDKFNRLAGPDATARSITIAKDPYAAAKFFHFIVRAILNCLMGIEVHNGRITRKIGIYGVVKAYVGMVESQGRGMLHLHMLVFLDGAPRPSVMAQCLRGDQFRQRVAGFISVNLRADVGVGVEEMRSMKATPGVGFNRPLDPWHSTYAQDVVSQEKHLARSLQLHECSIGRCIQNRNGRRFCKNRAPWKTSAEDWINEKGEWGMKRLNPYLNGFNPTILETIFCNNDVKLITNGAETQDSVWYFSAYQTKKKKRSNNTSAIVAKRFAFHNVQEKANKEDKDVHKRLITRCATALNREQEFSASEVVSYLMGWGDRYISHQFVPIYLDGIGAALRKTYPDLLDKRWDQSWPFETSVDLFVGGREV
ncbi:ATP-dependent DNA helicase PIF1 [Lentinula edodes]|uniref:ATP-dependent DNA helicase PIF1 n=1 Tax=Lentinula edodes TaxID=5353 RepID=A0A1Q3E138_LENED|nr:ATP-dependent DNA helicase PIF1 [Lentinula edodes]